MEVISLLAREYVAAALAARTEQPQREQFKTHEEYEKAWIAWNRNNRKIDHARQAISKKYNPGEQPQREQFKTHEEYEKAWLQWSKTTRKAAHASQDMLKKQTAKGEKEQEKHFKGATHTDSRTPSHTQGGCLSKPCRCSSC